MPNRKRQGSLTERASFSTSEQTLKEQMDQEPIPQPAQKTKLDFNLFVTPLLIGSFCACALVAAEAMFYSPLDVELLGVVLPITIFACNSVVFGSVVLSMAMLPFLLFKKPRLLAIQCLIGALCLASPPMIAWKFAPTDDFRLSQIQQIERNAEPLIQAIDKFSSDNNRPPDDLQALVPKYIAKLPTTGESRNRSFSYKIARSRKEAPWELSLRYVLAFPAKPDRLIYNPSENYSQDDSSTIERIGKWALVHPPPW